MVTARAYRFMPNTSNDDDTRYRSREEVNEWRQRDPIARLRSRLGRAASAVEDCVSAEVAEAAKWAEAEPEAAPNRPEPHVDRPQRARPRLADLLTQPTRNPTP